MISKYIFRRKNIVNQLLEHRDNGMVKIITGIRRSGKSFLLFTLLHNELIMQGVPTDHLIEIALDDLMQEHLRTPLTCLQYIRGLIKDEEPYIVMIDEVQLMERFPEVLNSLLHIRNVDIFVTGSNSRFLSSDIVTDFRGRGDEIHIAPLSFSEFAEAFPEKSWEQAWDEYMLYGGLPHTLLLTERKQKEKYLKDLFKKTYLKDIVERNNVRDEVGLGRLLDIICSNIGSLTNPKKLENTFCSSGKKDMTDVTIRRYIDHMKDAYLLQEAERYDVKGKNYISTPQKYYLSDLGLRNARLNFRQVEETHLMENAIYNELVSRGYSVDVGVVEVYGKDETGKQKKTTTEVDFVVNSGSRRYYIQSAYALPTEDKENQELRPLRAIPDSFHKIVIVAADIMPRHTSDGILIMGLKHFFMHPEDIESALG